MADSLATKIGRRAE